MEKLCVKETRKCRMGLIVSYKAKSALLNIGVLRNLVKIKNVRCYGVKRNSLSLAVRLKSRMVSRDVETRESKNGQTDQHAYTFLEISI